MSTSARLFLVGILSVLGMEYGALATSITIESGFIGTSTRLDMEPRFSLFGPEFHLSGAAPTGELSRPSVLNGAIGQPFTLATTVTFSSIRCCIPLVVPDQLTYQGVTYQQPFPPGPPSSAIYSGTFRFAASFPNLEAGSGLPFPNNFGDFTFSGNVIAPFGELTLEGGGFATATFLTFGSGIGQLNSFNLEFAPIPEPATHLLVSSGFLLYWIVSRWRRTWKAAERRRRGWGSHR
jgi:hypothetical protein